MTSGAPFIDPATGELDTTQILSEVIPHGKLIALFVAISIVPFGARSATLETHSSGFSDNRNPPFVHGYNASNTASEHHAPDAKATECIHEPHDPYLR